MTPQVMPKPVTVDAGLLVDAAARLDQLAHRLTETWGQPFQVRDAMHLGLREAAESLRQLPQLGAMTYRERPTTGRTPAIVGVGLFLGLLVIGLAMVYLRRPEPFQVNYPTTDVLDTGAECIYAWHNQAWVFTKWADACPPKAEAFRRWQETQ